MCRGSGYPIPPNPPVLGRTLLGRDHGRLRPISFGPTPRLKRWTAGSFLAVPTVQTGGRTRRPATCGIALASASSRLDGRRGAPVQLWPTKMRDCGSEGIGDGDQWCVEHRICELCRNGDSNTEGRMPRSSNPPLRVDVRLQPPHPSAVTSVTKSRYTALYGATDRLPPSVSATPSDALAVCEAT
jgi:hypothetical protein